MAENEKQNNLISRPPVVVVLGHVDHGKTSILDYIKKSHIAEKESGGITQHIGAYEIACPPSPSAQADGRREEKDKKITFIDTPGHEAFSAMRSRGARVADIAILVVAAEEGVKPQTKEAIEHIKKSQIPMIVAINKIDKSEADPQRVKRELSVQNILVESVGGKIPSVEVSAKTGQGIPELLELILLVAEIENLKADVSGPAKGLVIESFLDSKRGPIATLILEKGVLNKGDVLGTSSAAGKIKIIEDFQGRAVGRGLPSMPIVVLGFEQVPGVGEEFRVFEDIETSKKEIKIPIKSEPEVFDIESEKKVLNIILKVDVLGTLEAIKDVLKKIPGDQVVLRILKAEVGDINESDIKLAQGGRAKIIGFRVKTNPAAQKLAEREKITIIIFQVIYELVQAVRQLLEKRIVPENVRTDLGKIKVLAVFLTEKNRQIIGGKVIEGKVQKGVFLEVFRNEDIVGKGKIIELQRDKKKIGEVTKGQECGILYEGDVKIEEGDVLQVYIKERKKTEL
ncbi:MAG: translation initiation factor IF-2 [Candidatus Nealsonbacteria bacterium]|nr:translation initiation factor IF-2 [Candidatus Nealsonbacteria bacterium]